MNNDYLAIAAKMSAALASFLILTGTGAAQAELHFYELGESQISMEKAAEAARSMGLIQMKDPNGGPLPIWTTSTGAVRGSLARGKFYISPDLFNYRKNAPSGEIAERNATAYVKQFGLLPDDVSSWTPKLNFWKKQSSTPEGVLSTPITPVVNVQYLRSLDSLPVMGPASAMTVNVNIDGIVGGLASVRPAIRSERLVLPKSDEQIKTEYAFKLSMERKLIRGTPKLVERLQCYWEENENFIQPVWLYKVLFTDENGNQTASEIPIPIAKNMPEPLMKGQFVGFEPIMPQLGGDPGGSGRVTTLKLGQYVVRGDSDPDICLNVVNAFYNNAATFAPLTGHFINRTQYYWNHDWLWKDTATISDNAQYYAGAVHMATFVAHASPWQFSCLGSSSELVKLSEMNHFGAATGVGNPDKCYTSYMLVASCSMMPAPGDPFGGSYLSGSPFAVYWNMFWGMHGMYGFRTTAGKQSAVDGFAAMGLRTGLGHPNLASWLDSTSALSHSSNWNYGTIVIPTGRESDIIYNTTALPKATSLTMWWNHS
ncbi:MAG: hypothetical protein ACAH95_06410 [Fimbriimonas sp.]